MNFKKKTINLILLYRKDPLFKNLNLRRLKIMKIN